MKKILIWGACFLIGGCASSPVEIPEWTLTKATVEVQQPLRRPELPSPVSSTEDTVTFSRDSFRVLLDFVDIADGNFAIAEENAGAAEAQARAYNQLIEVGTLMRSFAQIREEQLARERRDHFIDNLFLKGLIALGVLVSL